MSPSNANGVITIGGSGNGARNRGKHSRFELLDESVLRDEDLQPVHRAESATSTHHSGGKRRGDEENQESGDEIPLKGVQKRI